MCSLSRCGDPSWVPHAPVLELFTSNHRSISLVQRVLGITTSAGARRLYDLRLGSWLTRNRVQVVFSEYLQVASAVVDLCRQLRTPIVAHAHGYDVTAQVRQARVDSYLRRLRLMDEIVVGQTI